MNITFPAKAAFKSLELDLETENWTFRFEGNIYASATGFWRVYHEGKLHFVSLDQGHTFGLPKPEDLVTEINTLLVGHMLQKIEVLAGCGDLMLHLSGGFQIELLVTSMGYETTEFRIEGKRYIGQGGGNYFIVDA